MLLVSGMWKNRVGRFCPARRFAITCGTLIATLILAVIFRTLARAVLSGNVYWSDILGILAAQIVISWLFNASGGWVLAVMLLHLLNNTIAGEFVLQWFSGADLLRLWWLLAILWSLLAVGLLISTRWNLGRKTAVQSETTVSQAWRASRI